MHELSLMESVLDIVRESAGNSNIVKVNKVKLVIGKLSMALPDSLQFAFQVLAQDDMFGYAALEIEEKDVVCRCQECTQEFTVQDGYVFKCPVCGSSKAEIIAGRELYVDYFEGEEADGAG